MLAPIFRSFCAAVCCAALAGPALADDASEINRLFSAGQQTEAFTRLDALIAAKPRDPQLRFQKGVLLAEAQRRSEAAAVFTQLTVDFPEIPEPYNNLAVIYAAQGDYDKARVALDAALRAKPDYTVALQNLGDVYAQLAKASYTHALRLDPASTAIPPRLALLRELVKTIPTPQAATPAATK
jgi:colicin import membrane protein